MSRLLVSRRGLLRTIHLHQNEPGGIVSLLDDVEPGDSRLPHAVSRVLGGGFPERFHHLRLDVRMHMNNQDGDNRFFCYANTDLRKEQQDDEILRFVQFWKQRTGKLPEELGHEAPTLLLTNQMHRSAAKLIERYARRMLIENNIADGVNFFHMDALSSAVALKDQTASRGERTR